MENEENASNRLWIPECSGKSNTPLRKPNLNPSNDLVTNSSECSGASNTPLRKPTINPISDLVTRSSLNAEAKEYIPSQRNVTAPPKFSAQNRLKRINIKDENPNDLDDNDFFKFQGLIVSVTQDPGQFEDLIDLVMETFKTFSDTKMIAKVAHFIFDQAVSEPSFRYNGARLCALIVEISPQFPVCIQNEIHKEIENNSCKPGFTLFLSELYVQLHSQDMAISLYKSVNKLLISGGDDNVKAVCHTLKLSGNLLEQYNKELMDTVFKKLEMVKPTVRDNIKNLMDSVFTLRQSSWGQDASFASSSSTPPNYSDMNFEQCCYYSEEDFDTGDDPDELYDPEPEMDEEIRLAFREFVKLNK